MTECSGAQQMRDHASDVSLMICGMYIWIMEEYIRSNNHTYHLQFLLEKNNSIYNTCISGLIKYIVVVRLFPADMYIYERYVAHHIIKYTERIR